jgi:hypothetical protein
MEVAGVVMLHLLSQHIVCPSTVSLATEAADNMIVHCLHSARILFVLEAGRYTPDLNFNSLKPEVHLKRTIQFVARGPDAVRHLVSCGLREYSLPSIIRVIK